MSSGIIDTLQRRIQDLELSPPTVCGVLTRVTGMLLAARGVRAPLGAYCEVMAEQGDGVVCEVVGFDGEGEQLMLVHGQLAPLKARAEGNIDSYVKPFMG